MSTESIESIESTISTISTLSKTMNFVIKAENLHKTYRLPSHSLHILRGVSLEVAAGERVAVTGKSGSGKSTLLHLLGGLDRPDRGVGGETLNVLGVDLLHASQRVLARLRAEKIGFVFQSFHLLNEMDVVENVALPAMALGVGAATCRPKQRAAELLRAVGLGDRLRHRPMELSGGEQQRVAIARAMMNSPSLIFADEPTGNLDAATGAQVLDVLFELAGGGGKNTPAPALVIVTHSKEIASRCERIVALESGIIGSGGKSPVPSGTQGR